MKYTIYLDLDGVIADFESDVQGYRESEEVMWGHVREIGQKYWENLKFLEKGRELWNYIKDQTPIILSAYPKKSRWGEKMVEEAIAGKYLWIRTHLGEEFARTAQIVDRHDKKNYAKPNAILIDDFIKNIKEFRSAGGIGIHFTSSHEAIRELKMITDVSLKLHQ